MADNTGHMTMARLQVLWHHALSRATASNPALFQTIQPGNLPRENDLGLWRFLDRLPSVSGSFYPELKQSGSFFKNYLAFTRQVCFHRTGLSQVIGKADYQAWCRHLATLVPEPRGPALAAEFRNWALYICPDKAQQGGSTILQDMTAKNIEASVLPYTGPQAKPADFKGRYTQLLQTLSNAQGRKIQIDTEEDTSGITDTRQPPWGLCTGLGPDQNPSFEFAGNLIKLEMKIGALAQWTATPGQWYNSSLLHLALADKSSPPWNNNPEANWEIAFGKRGILARMTGAVFFADRLTLRLRSVFPWGNFYRALITQYTDRGFWPLYLPCSDWAGNMVEFTDKEMEITVSTRPGHPVALGATVLGIKQFLE